MGTTDRVISDGLSEKVKTRVLNDEMVPPTRKTEKRHNEQKLKILKEGNVVCLRNKRHSSV